MTIKILKPNNHNIYKIELKVLKTLKSYPSTKFSSQGKEMPLPSYSVEFNTKLQELLT